MPWTKRDVIHQAFAELGIAGHEFDLQAEDLQLALRLLDTMMAEWASCGVRVGFSGGDGKGDVAESVEVPEWAVRPMYLGLAMAIAPTYGKTVNPATMTAQSRAYASVLARVVPVRSRIQSGFAGVGARYATLTPQKQPLVTDTGATPVYGD